MIKVGEKPGSPRVDDPQGIERYYWASGSDDELAIRYAVLTATPLIDRTGSLAMVRKDLSIQKPQGMMDFWDVTIRYEPTKSAEVGAPKISFSTMGGTDRIYQSLQTLYQLPASGETARDWKGALGVKDGEPEGCDVPCPSLTWTETHTLPKTWISQAYVWMLACLTGTVNLYGFRGFSPGEVLFMGAKGDEKDQDLYEIAFEFAAQPNVTNGQVGGVTVPFKRGWDKAFPIYMRREDQQNKTMVPRLIQVNVEQVLAYQNFSWLGIG
jgi:hypothetical protein